MVIGSSKEDRRWGLKFHKVSGGLHQQVAVGENSESDGDCEGFLVIGWR